MVADFFGLVDDGLCHLRCAWAEILDSLLVILWASWASVSAGVDAIMTPIYV